MADMLLIIGSILSGAFKSDAYCSKNVRKCGSEALLQICYIFFTLGFDMLTGKNGGDIINLNSGWGLLSLS